MSHGSRAQTRTGRALLGTSRPDPTHERAGEAASWAQKIQKWLTDEFAFEVAASATPVGSVRREVRVGFFGDEEPACLEGHVPGEAPVFAVDGPGG